MHQSQHAPSGCGVQGCLFGAVALFVILLLGLLILAVVRFQDRPSSDDMQMGHAAPATSRAAEATG